MYGKFIHKRLHQKQAPAGVPQKVFFGQGIRQFIPIETIAFVADGNCNLTRLSREGEVDFLPGVIAVTMNNRVHHALADGHSDLVQIVFVKAGLSCRLDSGVFGDIDALERRVQQSHELFRLSLLFRHGAEMAFANFAKHLS